MTFAAIMGGIILIGASISAWFFRKGGIYNPVDEDEVNPPPVVVETPQEAPVAPQPVSRPSLKELCMAMRDFEGLPGDANWRNHNPLNCKFYDPTRTRTDAAYLPKYRPVKRSPGGFAIFKDYSTGWLYGYNMLKHKIEKHPDWTLLDLIADHAPASDNNPVQTYAKFVGSRLGVNSVTFKVKDLMLG